MASKTEKKATICERQKLAQALVNIANVLDAQLNGTVLSDVLRSRLPPDQTQTVLGTSDAAKYLGVAPKTLAMWRWRGVGGPVYLKHGSKVVYRRSDLSAFLQGAERASTSDTFQRSQKG